MPNGPRLTKDQQRACRAYERVGALRSAYERTPKDSKERQKAKKTCEEYEIAVKALGANILRSGLSTAFADLMRRKASNVLEHLASFDIPGFGAETEGANLFQKANNLAVGRYMLATRETLQVIMWLKRACEATFEADEDKAPKEGAQPHA
jgi:CRISPR-associated protein Cmr5